MEIPLKGSIKDISLVKILVYLNREQKNRDPYCFCLLCHKKYLSADGRRYFCIFHV